MENRSVNPPDNRNYEYALNQSYQIAVGRLLKADDLESLCQKSESVFKETGTLNVIEVKYLGRTCQVTMAPPEVKIESRNDEEIPLKEKILILHYILEAKGTSLSGNLITFKELPEGPVYFRTFTQRTIKHLVNNFSDYPARLLEAARLMEGRKADYGDIGISIDAFPRIPVTLVLWKGDTEFPAEGNILYDSTVSDYLPTEDIIVLTETIVWKMVKNSK